MGTFSLLLDTEKERIETEQDGERFTIRHIDKGNGITLTTTAIPITDKAVAAEIAAELSIWVRQ